MTSCETVSQLATGAGGQMFVTLCYKLRRPGDSYRSLRQYIRKLFPHIRCVTVTQLATGAAWILRHCVAIYCVTVTRYSAGWRRKMRKLFPHVGKLFSNCRLESLCNCYPIFGGRRRQTSAKPFRRRRRKMS